MIEHYFFQIEDDLQNAAKKICEALGIDTKTVKVGSSTHVLNGSYFNYTVFGCRIKLEKNSYDYDDQYNYMLSISINSLSNLNTDINVLKSMSTIIRMLLSKNLGIVIAYEVADNNLEKIFPDIAT